MKKWIILFYLFISAGIKAELNAEVTWHHLEGLPCEETSSITQDANGFLWFGTRLGLVRYDGYDIKVFRNDMYRPHYMSSSDIKSLASDDKGSVFAGAFFGLNIINLQSQVNQIVHIRNNEYLNSLCSDIQGCLWMGTYEGLYQRFSDGQVCLYKDVPRDLIVQIKQSRNGDIYVLTEHNGIFVISAHGGCGALAGTKELKPRAIEADRTGTLWLGTARRGLYSVQSGTIQYHTGFDNLYVNDLLVCHDRDSSRILLATDKGIFDGDDVVLKGMNVQDLFEDRDGNVWASTVGHGIWTKVHHQQQFRVESRAFTHRTTPIMSQFNIRHLADSALWKTIPYINSLYEDEKGTTYLGTWNDGFYVIREGRICQHLNQSNTSWLHRNDIYAFTTLDSGNMLFSTWEGLYLFNPTRNEGRFLGRIGSTATRGTRALSFLNSDNHVIWLGLVGGIARICFDEHDMSKSSVTLYTRVNVSGFQNPADVAELTDVHIERGEYQIGGVYRMVCDARGNIWACTSEPGLLRYDRSADSFRSVSGELGILGDNVHSLEIDTLGNFWMTTNYGILQMQLSDSGTVIGRQLYTRENGLPANYLGSTMTSYLADGSIAFLNRDNLISVQPIDNFHPEKSRHVCVSDIVVNGKSLSDYNSTSDILPPYVSHITLKYNQNNITLSLSSRSYGEESSIRYTYQLEGVDEEIRQTKMGENAIYYSQLHPGTYVLHYGVAGDAFQEQTLVIEILQPLWWRWWARLIYTAVVIALIILAIRFIILRNRRNHQLQLLAAEKQALDEQYRAKMQFYTRVIHEFLTPVTLMSELINEMQSKVRPSLQATLFMLERQNDKLLESMNNTLDIHEKDNSIQEALIQAQEMTQTDRDFLRRCTESVNTHISDEDYSHQVMMSEVGASHATLYRKLKAITGMDATSFIRSIRMKAACQILSEQPNILISELAERVGYSNPKYFARCFKAEFGITPKEFNK